MSEIIWSGIEDENADLCVKRSSGYWDIIRGCNAAMPWVLHAPVYFAGSRETMSGVYGMRGDSRESLRILAEGLIHSIED